MIPQYYGIGMCSLSVSDTLERMFLTMHQFDDMALYDKASVSYSDSPQK